MTNARFYLDCRRKKEDGTSQLNLYLTGNNKKKLIPLGIYLRPEQFDQDGPDYVDTTHPHHRSLNLALRRYALEAEEIICAKPRISVQEAADAIILALFPERIAKKEPKEISDKRVLVNTIRFYASLKTAPATKALYEMVARHVERFRPATKLDDVGRVWLMEFEAYLSETAKSQNARALYFRHLRAVFNFAIDENLTKNYPFRKFKIKTVETDKRNLPVARLRKLLAMEVEEWQRPYRDFFALSFYLLGTNAKDLLMMPAGADAGDRLVFNRAKTGRLYSIEIPPEAREIIARYKGTRYMLNFMDNRTDHLQFIRRCNHALKSIGQVSRPGKEPEGEPLFPEVTTYWARHSWATIASFLNVNKDIISAALGHGQTTTTDIYIDFYRKKIDGANKRVIDYVLGRKKKKGVKSAGQEPPKDVQ